MKVGRGVAVKVAFSLAFTLLLMAAVELIAGAFVPAEDTARRIIPQDTVAHTLEWLDVNPAPLAPDPDLLWRNTAAARKSEPVNPRPYGTAPEWRIENNSAGYRGPELARDGGDEDVYRVLCVGDSITFGYNVDQAAHYPRQLGELLRARYPQHRFEVINAGVPGWSWLQGLRFLEIEGLDLAPDAVVIAHGTNDQLFPARITDEERFRRLGGRLEHTLHVVRTVASRTNTYRALQRFLPVTEWDPERDSPGCIEQKRMLPSCHRVSLDEIGRSVREVRELVTGAGADLIVANLDFIETVAVQGVRPVVDADGIPFVDAVAVLNARRAEDERRRATQLGLALPSSQPLPGAAPGAPAPRPRTKSVVLRVLSAVGTGSHRAEGEAYYYKPGYTFAEPAYDDGSHGDERAGDGVYSVRLEVPADVYALEYKFFLGDVPEFESLPPLGSKLGNRLLRVPGDTVGPVDVFGKSLFMAERAHPDAEGQKIVAEAIAERLERLPSFRSFVGAGATDTARGEAGHPE